MGGGRLTLSFEGRKVITALERSQMSPSRPSERNNIKMKITTLKWRQYQLDITAVEFCFLVCIIVVVLCVLLSYVYLLYYVCNFFFLL